MTNLIRQYRSLKKLLCLSDRGSALVEAALVLPVFLALVGGVYEFGFYFYQQQLIEAGVRDAARYLALTADPTDSASQSNAKSLAVYGSISRAPRARVLGWSAENITVVVNPVDNSSVTYAGGPTIRIITVSTTFADPTLGFLGLLGLSAPTISVSHQERSVGGSAPG